MISGSKGQGPEIWIPLAWDVSSTGQGHNAEGFCCVRSSS